MQSDKLENALVTYTRNTLKKEGKEMSKFIPFAEQQIKQAFFNHNLDHCRTREGYRGCDPREIDPIYNRTGMMYNIVHGVQLASCESDPIFLKERNSKCGGGLFLIQPYTNEIFFLLKNEFSEFTRKPENWLLQNRHGEFLEFGDLDEFYESDFRFKNNLRLIISIDEGSGSKWKEFFEGNRDKEKYNKMVEIFLMPPSED
jgi:hypothetical protein